jgi:hypothetical protein
MIISIPSWLQEAKPLGYFVEHLAELPSWLWLYLRADAAEILLSTPCYAQASDSRELSDEEMDAFETDVETAGFRRFLNRDQIEEIMENFKQQRSAPTAHEIAAAIAYYWTHDAFIGLSGNAA